MYARRVKRKCGVRGCRNTESYAISRTREAGYSVIICKSCLKDALDELKGTIPQSATLTSLAGKNEQPDTKAELKGSEISDAADKKAVKKKASTTASVKKN